MVVLCKQEGFTKINKSLGLETGDWFIIKSHRSKILNCVIIYKLQTIQI